MKSVAAVYTEQISASLNTSPAMEIIDSEFHTSQKYSGLFQKSLSHLKISGGL